MLFIIANGLETRSGMVEGQMHKRSWTIGGKGSI